MPRKNPQAYQENQSIKNKRTAEKGKRTIKGGTPINPQLAAFLLAIQAQVVAADYVYTVENTVATHNDPSFYQVPFRDLQTRNIVLTQNTNITNQTSWYLQALNQVAMTWKQEVDSRTQYVDHRHYDAHGNYMYTSHDLENLASELFVEEFGNSMGNHVSDALLPIAALFFQNQTIRTACTTLLSGFKNVDFTGTLSNVPVELCATVQNAVISQAQSSATEATAAVAKANLALLALIALAYPGFALSYAVHQSFISSDRRPLTETLCEGFLLPFMCCAAACGSGRRQTSVYRQPDHISYAEPAATRVLELYAEGHETPRSPLASHGMYAITVHPEEPVRASTPSVFPDTESSNAPF